MPFGKGTMVAHYYNPAMVVESDEYMKQCLERRGDRHPRPVVSGAGSAANKSTQR
jgi:hypothetical protein